MLSTGSTQEDPSPHNWDIKFEIKQTNLVCLCSLVAYISNITDPDHNVIKISENWVWLMPKMPLMF